MADIAGSYKEKNRENGWVASLDFLINASTVVKFHSFESKVYLSY